ncbi:MAG: inositol monophosphatase family protein [Candidatus Nitrosocosmicus sp.]
MLILEILKECANSVYENTKNIIGTVEGRQKFDVGAGGDVSTKIDLVAEKSVFDTLKRNNFLPDVIGEECGFVNGKDHGLIVMDGIDGTTNANCGLPFYCCSLAYSSDKKLDSVTDAVVFNLLSGDVYYASKNKGSYVNQKKLDLTRKSIKPAKDMIVGLNISGLSEELFISISKLVSAVNHIRHLGANALEVCYFAQGSIDAYVDLRDKIRPIDMAACYLIAKEAGGFVFDMVGNQLNCELTVDSRMSFIAVSNLEMFNLLFNLYKQGG